MQIVWNTEIVEKMRSTHTVLELETFDVEGKSLTAYCVVPPEKVILDIADLENLTALHNSFLKAYAGRDTITCESIAGQLQGRLGGELDTFYEEIINRLKTTT
jgi:hypothetical protein